MKWFIPFTALLIAALIIGATHNSLAANRSAASKKITCSLGGKYKHSSSSAHQARQAAATACFESQMEIFKIQRGSLPDDEQADYIIESCVNQTTCN